MATSAIKNDCSRGLVTARDPSSLGVGEMTVARSCEYRVGSPHLYKQNGRSDTGNALGAPVLALNKLQFDEGTDVLVADAGGVLYESPVSETPVFASVGLTGLSTTAVPQYTGFKNEWVRCNGVDQNLIRETSAVPGGTQGNWRPAGVLAAAGPTLASITHNANGGQILRPTTFTNSPFLPGNPISYGGYRSPELAFDGYGGVGQGTVSGASGQTVLTGVGTTFTLQLSIGATLTFADGTTATVLTITSNTLLGVSSNLTSTLSGSTFTYAGSTAVDLAEVTQALGQTSDVYHQVSPLIIRTVTCTWQWTTNLAATDRVLSVLHAADVGPQGWGPAFGETGMTVTLEYSTDGGSTWLALGVPPRHQPFPNTLQDSVAIPDTVDSTNLRVRATATSALGKKSGKWLEVFHAVDDIRLSTGATTAYTATYPISYGVSEVYTDSNLVVHPGNIGPLITIQPSDLQNATAIKLTLPTPQNSLAQKFIIWRSADTPTTANAFPTMYKVGEKATTDTTFTDTLSIRPDDTAAIAGTEQYLIIGILYSTGETATAQHYSVPPIAFMTLPFQGCLCYFPSDTDSARRIYYSLPATISTAALEQVPEQYYLDFQTPRNDQVKSGAIVNGGRSMLAFFENYTMLVNYLPQGADPGGFNNTVKEYVSNVRGCAGRLACAEFTLPSGQTLVAAVDGLGVWITNGVNLVDEWSLDLDWDTAMEGVDLSSIEMYDKPQKRRLEMLYTAADGTREEYHFFYGRMKSGAEGKPLPLITGPHTAGTRCRHYTIVDGKWSGFSGDSTATGKVYLEDSQAADDSHGYDSTGIVPWTVEMGDLYLGDISRAHIVEIGTLKFTDDNPKEFTLTGTFTRDSGTTKVVTKTLGNPIPSQIYWHEWCDRHRVGFSDLTNTEAPAFVSYSLDVRPAGPSRDR